MNREQKLLISEINTVKKFISETSKEDVLDKMSMEGRLKELQDELEDISKKPAPVQATLTFRGKPVIGNHGIFAEFGMNATRAFINAVNLMAADIAGDLKSRGPIPNKEQNQLLITGTAIGSFGFELEEYTDDETTTENDSNIGQALAGTQELLNNMEKSDDELTNIVAETDDRVLGAIRSFLEILSSQESVCSIGYKDKTFSFSDVGQVKRSLKRLEVDNIHEEEKIVTGDFWGIIPSKRMFEFRQDDDTTICGKIGPTITDPIEINKHLFKRVNIKVASKYIGNGQPKYLLNELPTWDGVEGSSRPKV